MKPPLDCEKPIQISPLVTRILANNGNFMTGPGTNTYLIGHDDMTMDREQIKHVRSYV